MEWVFLGIGIIIGGIAATLLLCRNCNGYLRIDTSDPEEPPYIFLELAEHIDKISKAQYVKFKVKCENYISHE